MMKKLMIASDIHGSALWCGRLLECFEKEKADRLLVLGDILYHGPRNDLPDEYAPKRVIAMLNAVRDRLLCVRGNCDGEVDQMVLDFPIMAEYALICLAMWKSTRRTGIIIMKRRLRLFPGAAFCFTGILMYPYAAGMTTSLP